MVKIPKSKPELEIELEEQIPEFRSSCKGYDEGNRWEVKRLAGSVYKLVFDGTAKKSNSKSLLGMLGLKSGLRIVSSKVRFGKNVSQAYQGGGYTIGSALMVLPNTPLVMLKFGEGIAEYIPLFEEPNSEFDKRNRLLTFTNCGRSLFSTQIQN